MPATTKRKTKTPPAPPQTSTGVRSIGVSDRVFLDGKYWEVTDVESGRKTFRIEIDSKRYAEQLQKRPINRYKRGFPHLEEFRAGELVTEEWARLCLKSGKELWQFYTSLTVRKGDL